MPRVCSSATRAAVAWAVLTAASAEAASEPPPLVRLKALSESEIQAARQRGKEQGLATVGTQRETPTLMKKGKWEKRIGPNGESSWIWRVRVQSPGATALRIHFLRVEPAAAGSLWVYGGTSRTTDAVSPNNGTDTEFWSGLIYGDAATIEFAPSSKKKTSKLPFEMDRISHQFR